MKIDIPVRVPITTYAGKRRIDGEASILETHDTVSVYTVKAKGWRKAHERWVKNQYPDAECVLEMKTVNYFDGVEEVMTRWKLNMEPQGGGMPTVEKEA